MALPLEGIKVVELAQLISGPYGGLLLADLGADVIKIEPPSGDQGRERPPNDRDISAIFLMANRNKRSVVVNLKDPRGQSVVHELVRGADVFLQNLKPGDVERFGLGYAQLSELNPRLVYCSVCGYGSKGPMADHPAMEFTLQAFSGFMSVNGEPEGPPLRVGASVVDLSSGMFAAMAIAFALVGRQRTGRGELVDVSLFESVSALLTAQAASYFATGNVPHRWGNAHGSDVPYQVFKTADGDLVVSAGSNRQFGLLCRLMGLEHLLSDPRYSDLGGRVRNREPLIAELSETFLTKGAAEWEAILEAAGVMCSRINTVAEALTHPQTAALDLVGEVPHPLGGLFRALRAPMRFGGGRPARLEAPPRLGQHTDDVLAEAGYSPSAIAELRAAGAIG